MNTYKVKIKGKNGFIHRIFVNRKGKIIDHNSEIDMQKWHEMNRKVLPMILSSNEKHNMLTILSFFLSAVQKEIISEFNGNKQFAVLQVISNTGAGKSTTMVLINRLFGEESILNTKGTLESVINRKFAETNAFPVVLDDYDNRYNNLLKIAYNSGQIYREDSKGKFIEYNLKAPVCVLGERLTDDKTLLNRSIVVELSSEWFNENKQRTYKIVRELNGMNLGYFNDGYLKMVLVLNKEKNLESIFRSAENRALEFSKGNKQITDRQTLALTVLSFGMDMLKEIIKASNMDYEITEDDYDAVFEQYLRNVEG